MGGFMDDEYVAEAQQLVVTEGFASLNEVVFRNKLTSRRAMVRAQIYGREGVEGVDASEVVHYRTYEDCLEAVNSGRADITSSCPSPTPRACSPTGRPTSRRPPLSIARLASRSPGHSRQDADLYSVLSKAVNSSQDEPDAVFSRNTMPAFGKKRTSRRSCPRTRCSSWRSASCCACS